LLTTVTPLMESSPSTSPVVSPSPSPLASTVSLSNEIDPELAKTRRNARQKRFNDARGKALAHEKDSSERQRQIRWMKPGDRHGVEMVMLGEISKEFEGTGHAEKMSLTEINIRAVMLTFDVEPKSRELFLSKMTPEVRGDEEGRLLALMPEEIRKEYLLKMTPKQRGHVPVTWEAEVKFPDRKYADFPKAHKNKA